MSGSLEYFLSACNPCKCMSIYSRQSAFCHSNAIFLSLSSNVCSAFWSLSFHEERDMVVSCERVELWVKAMDLKRWRVSKAKEERRESLQTLVEAWQVLTAAVNVAFTSSQRRSCDSG